MWVCVGAGGKGGGYGGLVMEVTGAVELYHTVITRTKPKEKKKRGKGIELKGQEAESRASRGMGRLCHSEQPEVLQGIAVVAVAAGFWFVC